MYNLNSDEYYENKIHDLERALAKTSSEYMQLDEKRKKFENEARSLSYQLYICKEDKSELTKSLNVAMSEIAILRENISDLMETLEIVEKKLKEWEMKGDGTGPD